MPLLETATDDLNRAAQDLAKQHAKYREAQDAYDAAVKKSNKEHDYWFKNPSERNAHDLQEAYAAQREAEQELNEEKRKFEEKMQAFLIGATSLLFGPSSVPHFTSLIQLRAYKKRISAWARHFIYQPKAKSQKPRAVCNPTLLSKFLLGRN